MTPRPCPASGRTIPGRWYPLRSRLVAKIVCPVCRFEQVTELAGKGRRRPTGTLEQHSAEAAA